MWTLLAALAQAPDSGITLFVHDPRGRPRPLDQCVDPLCRALVERLDAAACCVGFAVYGLRGQTAILDALVRAQDRGVVVRGVVDMDGTGHNYYRDTERLLAAFPDIRTDRAADLRLARERPYTLPDRCERPDGFRGPLQCLAYDLGDACLLAVHAAHEPFADTAAIMHHKFFVVDERYVWTGSANVSDAGTGGYAANAVALVDSPVVAGWYTDQLNEMLVEDRFHQEKTHRGPHRTTLGDGVEVEAWFSPTDRPITRAVRPLIREARSTVDVAVFYLTHKEIARDLIDAHRRGVRVRVLLDATSATNGYTKHELLRAAGIPVKIEDWGGKMHMKAAVVDGERLVLGSMNWTSAGEGGNDENTLIVRDRALAAQFLAAYERLWTAVPDRWLTGRPDPESWQSGTACIDGVDDDHDGLVDAEDPGCSANPPPLPPLPPHQVLPKDQGEGRLPKGVLVDGRKYLVDPKHPAYARIRVGTGSDAVWLCGAADARAAGYRSPLP